MAKWNRNVKRRQQDRMSPFTKQSVALLVSHRGQEMLPFTGGGHFTVITEDITDITHH